MWWGGEEESGTGRAGEREWKSAVGRGPSLGYARDLGQSRGQEVYEVTLADTPSSGRYEALSGHLL